MIDGMITQQRPSAFQLGLLVVWLISMAVALWWFTLGDLRHFAQNDSAVVFEGEAFTQSLIEMRENYFPGEDKRPILIHFRDGACSCTAENDKHVAEIITRYKGENIDLLVVEKDQFAPEPRFTALHGRHAELTSIPKSSLVHQLPSSPAVAILTERDTLAYFGPYSLGALCNSKDGFVESTLSLVLSGQASSNINTIGVGCFCPWAIESKAQV